MKDAEEIIGTSLKGDRFTDDERYKKSIDNIYRKLRPIWVDECRDAVWLLKDEYVREVSKIIYLDDQLGGNLDPTSLSDEKQNLLGWKQVQNTIDRYRAIDYTLVDTETTKAILSSIIKNKNARDIDRLKAIEMYSEMYNGDQLEGVTFLNDLAPKKVEREEKKRRKDAKKDRI